MSPSASPSLHGPQPMHVHMPGQPPQQPQPTSSFEAKWAPSAYLQPDGPHARHP